MASAYKSLQPGSRDKQTHGVASQPVLPIWQVPGQRNPATNVKRWWMVPEEHLRLFSDTHTHTEHIRVYIILGASHLLTLHQQNHPRQFFSWLQFLVFLSEGPVDPRRRHLFLCYRYFHKVHLSQAKLWAWHSVVHSYYWHYCSGHCHCQHSPLVCCENPRCCLCPILCATARNKKISRGE